MYPETEWMSVYNSRSFSVSQLQWNTSRPSAATTGYRGSLTIRLPSTCFSLPYGHLEPFSSALGFLFSLWKSTFSTSLHKVSIIGSCFLTEIFFYLGMESLKAQRSFWTPIPLAAWSSHFPLTETNELFTAVDSFLVSTSIDLFLTFSMLSDVDSPYCFLLVCFKGSVSFFLRQL